MNIQVFDQKLSKIKGIKATSKDTEIILIDDLKKEFNTPAWKESWSNVDKLLKTPEFKVITVTERRVLLIKSQVPQEKLINYTTKLEVGILALLWCQGTQKQRTAFFLKLANPIMSENIGCTDDELKFIFVKLLEYSTDLPLRYEQAFMDISRESITAHPATNLSAQGGGQTAMNGATDEDLFTIEEIIDREMEDLSQLDEKYCEESFYYGWFIDEIFGYDSMCSTKEFMQVLENQKFSWIFDTV